MALRVSPERVRDVRFAEQWRGYRTDEVDEFVEQVAVAFDQLEARVEEAAQRTALAERRLDERGPDEDLRSTLVLAQRTAAAALEEAKAEAARMVADAEEQARSILAHIEERKGRIEGEIEARIDVELSQLGDRRAELEADVERLSDYVEGQRGRLVEELRTHLEWFEQAGPLAPVPTLSPHTETVRAEAPRPESVRPPVQPLVVESVPIRPEPVRPPTVGPVPPRVTPDPRTEVAAEAAAADIATGDGAGDDATDGRRPDDDTALDDLDVIPWGNTSMDENPVVIAGPTEREDLDDDPFITELRRAADDPEPLGPRDESDEAIDPRWSGDVDLYQREKSGSMRSRRRRRS